jgi:hypothetical protein
MYNSPTPRRRMGLVATTLFVALALLAAACSSSDDSPSPDDTQASSGNGDTSQNVPVDAPGVTDTEIRFSALGTETNNPLGNCVLSCLADGVNAYFDYVNTEKGGIYGRDLVLSDVVDDEFGANQQKALEIISADDTFATFSSTSIPSGWQSFADEGWPLYIWNTLPSSMVDNESVFGDRTVFCLETGCPQRAIAYAMREAGAKKLAVVGYGIADSSKQCVAQAAASVEKFSDVIGGGEVVYSNDSLQFGLANGVAPEITAMKNAGADAFLGCIEGAGLKTFMQEAERQDLDMTILQLPYDKDAIAQSGNVFDGGYVQTTVIDFEADPIEATEKYHEYMAKLGKEESATSIYGWINAALAYEGLVKAGPEFSREKVVEATNQLTDFAAGGFTSPMDWTVGHQMPTPTEPVENAQPYECYAFVKVESSTTFSQVGDPAKPFVCWPGDTWEWSEPELMSFAP